LTEHDDVINITPLPAPRRYFLLGPGAAQIVLLRHWWRYSPTVSMSLLSTPSTACQSLSACMIARLSAYAFFLETVVGRSEIQMLKRRGARTDPYGTPFLRRRNLLRVPFPVLRVKLQLPTSPWSYGACVYQVAIPAACWWGHDAIQCRRLLWHRQTQLRPSSFLAEKLSSMSCVSRVTWSTVNLPCRKLACSCRNNGSKIGSTRA